ncbi:MAG: 50S ribosomal protein L24 [Deltaproteobacteria bacterium]|nr:50S ribosomal protein L24 [Deltaproteobacteria bacterium]
MLSVHIKTGDTVKVLSGSDKNKTGKVLEILRDKGRARVEGVRLVKRHMKKGRSASAPEGGIIESWGPIAISNLSVVCPKCNEATRLGRGENKDGKKVRICKKCKEQVD